MSEPTTLTVGDTAPGLTGTVGADVTGATAVAHIRRPDGTVFEKTLEWVTPLVGAWRIASWDTDELVASGWYEIEVEVTFSGGGVQTFWADPVREVPVTFWVRDQIA